MVPGAYNLSESYSATELADEDQNYNRRDFTPSSGTASAFLVRMRRTPLWNVPGSLDNAPGVSSAGPTLPILFGRGSMMARSGTGSQLSVATGITVRATAIAAAGDNISFSGTTYTAGRAKTAGRSYAISESGGQPGFTTPGVAPFALEAGFWASCCSGSTSITATLMSTGGSASCAEFQTSTATVGLLLSTGTDATGHWAASATSIGQPPSLALADSTGAFDDSALVQDGQGGATGGGVTEYVPIYTTVSLGGQSWTIIGFGYLSAGQWYYTPANQQTGQPAQLTISPTPPGTPPAPVGSQNISGTLAFALPASFSQTDVSTLFLLHAGEATSPSLAPDNMTNSIYAPVLVNHYIGPNP